MKDNVVEICHRSGESIVGEVDPSLSAQLGRVYDTLCLERKNSSVITSEATPGYEPFFARDGSMRIGEYGIADFDSRFAHTEASPAGLYVVFMGLKHGLKAILEEDDALRGEMQAVSRLAIRKMPRFRKTRDVRKVGEQLIGQTAADIAMKQQTMHVQPNKQLGERVRIQIAAKHMDVPIINIKEIKTQRNKNLGEVAMEVPAEVRKAMDKAIKTTLRQRQEEAAS